MDIQNIRLLIPDGCNIIVGQSHFIKTAEDLYEACVTGCAHCKFGIAFCEASGPCLIRVEGNDEEQLQQMRRVRDQISEWVDRFFGPRASLQELEEQPVR